MKILIVILAAALCVRAQTTRTTLSVANDTNTGTRPNRLAKLLNGNAVTATTSDTAAIIGVVVSGAGTSGYASIAQAGTHSCDFDGPTTANDYVVASIVTGGMCHDTGSATYPASAASVIGRVVASGGTYVYTFAGAPVAGTGGNASFPAQPTTTGTVYGLTVQPNGSTPGAPGWTQTYTLSAGLGTCLPGAGAQVDACFSSLRTVTGTTDTILPADVGGAVEYAAATTISVPQGNLAGNFPPGRAFMVRAGTAALTLNFATSLLVRYAGDTGVSTYTVNTGRSCAIYPDSTAPASNYHLGACN